MDRIEYLTIYFLIKNLIKNQSLLIPFKEIFKIECDTSTWIGAKIVYTGNYESALKDVFKSVIKKGDYILDVGANIGFHSLYFAELVGEKGQVTSFEPVPYNFNQLTRNIALNSYKHIIAKNIALGDKNEKISIAADEASINPGTFNLFDQSGTTLITCLIGDEVIGDEKVDFIKIDVEGYESFVLEGLINTIKKNRPTIIFEYDVHYHKKTGLAKDHAFSLLKPLDYRFMQIYREGLVTLENFEELNQEIYLLSRMTKKIAIISTHPIQYYAPVFQLLAQKIQVKVFYTAGDAFLSKYDHGFKQKIDWDIPLLTGYDYEFLDNVANDKGSHHFKGINNPNAIEKIKSFEPDAILIYGWAYISHLKIINYFKGKIPVYFRGDSTLLNQKPSFKNFLKRIFLKWVYKHVDVAFYVGKANKSYFKKYGLKEEQLVFAPHAIDNQRFGEDRSKEAFALRSQFSIKDDDILIIFAGKLEPVKNPMLLLTAVKKLNRPNVKLLFVGNGVLEDELKAAAKDNSEKIHFLSFQNQTQMPVVYQACDLFCLPSTSETWGLAINEAMATAKPILVSDKVGCAMDLVGNKNGAVFLNGDLTDLLQKLIALTNDKKLLEEMGKKFIITNSALEFSRPGKQYY